VQLFYTYKQMLIFDIGANNGNYARTWASRGHAVVAVEASPATYSTLVRSMASFPSVTTVHGAVCDAPTTTITLYDRGDTLSTLNKWWLTSSESRHGHCGFHATSTVPVVSLDTLIATHGLPDMLKIDVEGAEDSVLRSLSSKPPVVCFEYASEMLSVTVASLSRLDELGYTNYHIQSGDDYSYLPSAYDLTLHECRRRIQSMRPKVDWGMVWAS